MNGKEITNHPSYFVSEDGKVYHKERELKPMKVGKGYYQVSIDNKRYMVHRLVAMMFLEGFTTDKQVHHIDGNIHNNSANNLAYLKQEEHLRLHKMKNPMSKICRYCGNIFIPHPTKRKTAVFCNRDCYIAYKRKGNNESV